MTCGETDEDLRRIRSYVPGRGFEDGFIACPDDTGSHLGKRQRASLARAMVQQETARAA